MLLFLLPYLKAAIYLSAAVSLYLFRDLRAKGEAAGRSLAMGISDPYVIAHKARVKMIIVATLVTIVLAEFTARFVVRSIRYPFFFWIHILFFVIPFLILFVALLVRTGRKEQNKEFHRRWGPWCVRFGIGMQISGAILTFLVF